MKTVEIMRTGTLFVHYKVTCKHKLHLKEKKEETKTKMCDSIDGLMPPFNLN